MANKFLEKLDDIHLEIKLGSRKELLSFDEAALMLGFGKSYLYKLTSNRQIPHFKPILYGNAVRYFFHGPHAESKLSVLPMKKACS